MLEISNITFNIYVIQNIVHKASTLARKLENFLLKLKRIMFERKPSYT